MISILVSSILAAALPNANLPELVSKVPLKNVAFAKIIDDSLILSAFDATPIFGKDAAFVVSPNELLKPTTKASFQKIGGSIVWPNTVTKAPSSLFGMEGMVVPGGFLVPGKTNGGISFAPGGNGVYQDFITLFQNSNGYFYHQVEFIDVNGDGALDMISCRAKKPLTGAGYGDLATPSSS
jgi:hypothetical protein